MLFDAETYEKVGVENACVFEKKPIKRYAIQMEEDGKIMTREGMAVFHAGDWIVEDEQGGKYPVHDADFNRLYHVPEGKTDGWFLSNPKEVVMFKTDKELHIATEWGNYKASAGDFVVLNKDGSFGCPVKPDAVNSAYKFVREEK